MESLMEAFRVWLSDTTLSTFMRTNRWAWPIVESIHFIGLTFLIGTVGLFDLRLLGLLKRIPLIALHRLIPWGICGYGINVITGAMFFTGYPDQYMYNPSFQLKMLFMSLAGLNVILFYTSTFRELKHLGPDDEVPLAARLAGGASLSLWIGIITLGRMITFFRPPNHWCPWCF